MDRQELVYWMPDRGIGRELDRTEKALRKEVGNLPPENMPMACALLLANRQYLRDQLPQIYRRTGFVRRLPRGEKDARILEAARSICWDDDAELHPDRLVKALLSMQPEGGWTLAEMDFLSLSLRAALLEKAAGAAARCRAEMMLKKRARALMKRLQSGRRNEMPKDRDVLEALWELAQEQEQGQIMAQVRSAFADMHRTTEQASHRISARRTLLFRTLKRTLSQLYALDGMDVRAAAERVLPVFRELGGNTIFRQMDRDSRWYYARRAARIGKEYGVSERDCARAACALAAQSQGDADMGEYLIRRPEAIGTYLGAGRIRFSPEDVRWEVLALLPGAVLLGFLLLFDVRVYMAVPAGACAAAWTGWLFRRTAGILRSRQMLPRLRKAENSPVVTAVYAVVQSRGQLLRLCRKLLTEEAGSGRADMDFLLLCHVPWTEEENSRTRELTQQAERAFASMNAGAGRTRFHFVLLNHPSRGISAQGADAACRAANWLCGLIAAGEGGDRIAYATSDACDWQGRFRYVMLLDAQTRMPPGEGDKLVRAMEHPLQRGRQALIFPVLRRWASHAPGRLESFLGMTLSSDPCMFDGVGIMDAVLWHEQVKTANNPLAAAQVRGLCARDCVFTRQAPLTLREWMDGQWQLGHNWAWVLRLGAGQTVPPAQRLAGAGLFVLPVFRCMVLALAAWGHAPWLALLALPTGRKEEWLTFLLLPGTALMRLMGAWGVGRKMPSEFSQPAASLACMLSTGAAVLMGALNGNGSMALCAVGMTWVLSPLVGLWADAPRLPRPRFSSRQSALLRQDARRVWDYFADTAGEEQHFLPPEWVQQWPDDRQSPSCSLTGAAFYLLAVVCAREMGFVTGEEMNRRLRLALDTLENIPWQDGLPCARWECASLSSLEGPRTLDAGVFGMCLLCAAQAVRVHLKDMPSADGQTAVRLDALFDHLDFTALYDRKKGRFFADLNHKNGHVDLLTGGGALLALCAVIKGQAPFSHLLHLDRRVVRAGGGAALLSRHGSLADYLFPALLMPLPPDTLFPAGARNALRVQLASHGMHPWGQSDGYGCEPDADWVYRMVSRGMAQLADQPADCQQGAACYAAYLALPYAPRAALHNIEKWKNMGADGPWGLYDGADFGSGRLESAPRCARIYDSMHQAWTLCALCEALEGKKIGAYLRGIPRAESALMLFEMPVPRRVPMRIAVRSLRRVSAGKYRMDRTPFQGGVQDGFAVGFQRSYWAMNGRGTGEMVLDGRKVWQTRPAWDWDGGWRLYVAAGQDVVRPSLGQARMRTGEILFTSSADGIQVLERRTLSPLNGSAVVEVRIRNRRCMPVETVVTAYCPLSPDWCADVHLADGRTLVASGGQGGIALMAVGNAAGLQWTHDSRVFFGMGDDMQPDFVSGAVDERAESSISCLASRMVLTVPPMGETACAFVLGAAKREEALCAMLTGMGSIRQVREVFALSRGAAVQQARQLDLDERRQRLYGRLLGAVWFSMQPHQQCMPAHDGGQGYHLPLVTLMPERQGDQALLRHGLLFFRALRRMGMGLRIMILCPRETDGQTSVQDQIRQMMERMGLANEKNISVQCLNQREARPWLLGSRLVLRGGETLEAQLDQLTQQQTVPMKPVKISCTASVVAGNAFTEDGVYLSPGMGSIRHVLSGEKLHLTVSDRGLLGLHCPAKPDAPLSRGTGAGAEGELAERIYVCWDEQTADILRGGVSLDMGGAVYDWTGVDFTCRTEVAVHPHEALSVRRVTLRAHVPFQGTLRWDVRFCMDAGEQFTYLMQRENAVLALGGGRMDVGFACVTGGACDVMICHAPHGMLVCPVELNARESVTLTLSLGSLRDALCALPDGINDGKQVLNMARTQVQHWLSVLRCYTMDAHTDRMLCLFLPLQARQALREAAGSAKARLLCALGLIFHDEGIVRQELERIRPEEADPLTRCVWVYACCCDLAYTGTADREQADQCLALLMQTENRKEIQKEQPEETQDETALWRLLAFSVLLPLVQGDQSAEAEKERLRLRRQAQKAWAQRAETRSTKHCCLSVCAGIHGRWAGDRVGRAAEEAVALPGSDAIWVLWALCSMDEGAQGWELLKRLLKMGNILQNPFRLRDGLQAGFLLHVVLDGLLGFKRRGDRMAFAPVLGAGEEEITLVYRFGRGHYHFTADGRTAMVMLDGKRLQGSTVSLQEDDSIHEARFPLRKV